LLFILIILVMRSALRSWMVTQSDISLTLVLTREGLGNLSTVKRTSHHEYHALNCCCYFYLCRRMWLCFSSVCLSVCLSDCPSDYSQTCERILTKFFDGEGHDSRTKLYNFGSDPDHASVPGVQVRNLDPPDRRRFVLCEYIIVIDVFLWY